MADIMDQTFAYYQQIKGWDKKATEIAKTMHFLQDQFPKLSEEFLFLLSCRRYEARKNSGQPVLAEEMDDVLRYVLQAGITSCGGCDIEAEDMPRFLLYCPQEVFQYILEWEAVENRGRFELNYPEMNEEMLASAVEETLTKIQQ